MKEPTRRESPKAQAEQFEGLIERARAPLYQDPFEGLCEQALAMSPEDRAERLQSCPRCGVAAGHDGAEAHCLLESLGLDLMSLQARKP